MNRRVKLWNRGNNELPWSAEIFVNGKRLRAGASSTPTKALDAAVNLGRRR